MLISERLEKSLNDVTKMSHEHCDNIANIVNDIKELKDNIVKKERELYYAIDVLCAELAKEIRNKQPGLSITINKGGCLIGYRTKMMNCRVRPYDNIWDFSGNDFGNQFCKRNPNYNKLDTQISELATAIVDFFNNHYISLGRS